MVPRRFSNWVEVWTNPATVFGMERDNADLLGGVMNAGIGGFMVGVVQLIKGAEGALFVILGPIIAVPILLIGSGMFYISAKIFGGRGTFTTQTYFMSIIIAPLIVILAILNLVPVVGSLLSLIVGIYLWFPLTIALKESHKYATIRSILTWLLPLMILGAIMWGITLWYPGYIQYWPSI